MASKKAAESTLYHVSPKGFWKKFREITAVNPEISSGLPIQGVHRYPPPASRPEKYATPATKASDPAQNPYWKRDVRRAYPHLSVVTQSQLSEFLLQTPEGQALLGAPAEAKEPSEEQAQVPAPVKGPSDLAQAISIITSARKVYSESKLPPRLAIPHKRWQPEQAPNAPHDPDAYWPMYLVK